MDLCIGAQYLLIYLCFMSAGSVNPGSDAACDPGEKTQNCLKPGESGAGKAFCYGT